MTRHINKWPLRATIIAGMLLAAALSIASAELGPTAQSAPWQNGDGASSGAVTNAAPCAQSACIPAIF